MKHLPMIKMYTVPHRLQEYDTAGNYRENSYEWQVTISQMQDWRHEALILVHELVEMILTKHNGVAWADIDKFDIESGLDDPGACAKAPYHKEHMAAEVLEKQLAMLLGVKWQEYSDSFNNLKYKG